MRGALGVLLALLLGGCGERAVESAEELVLWHAYRGAEAEALAAAVGEFEAARGVRVRLVGIPHDALVNKITVAVPRGNGPDLFIYAHDRLGDWAEARLLEPVGLWADEALIDRFFPETVAPLVYRGDLYGLPLAFNTLALYYDTTLIEAPPRDTAEMVAQAKALRARDPEVWGLGYDLDSLYFHAPWLHGFGGRVYRGDRDELALDEPAAARSMAFVRRLVADDRIVPEELTNALVTTLFRQRKLAFVLSGPWFRSDLAGHDGWAVAPLPVIAETGQPARPFLGVEGLMMSARSPRKALAFELMGHLTGDAAALRRIAGGAQLVANQAPYEDPQVAADAFAAAFRAQVQRTVSLSNRPHMRRVWTPMERALSQAIVQGRAPEQALAEAVAAIRRAAE